MVPGTRVWPDAEVEAAITDMVAGAVATAQARHPGLTLSSFIARGPAVLVLRDRADQADLLVVGGRSHGALAGLLLGSVAAAVAVHASCSVVVVRGGYDTGDRRPIVVGLDDSGQADVAARFAFEQAAARGVRVVIPVRAAQEAANMLVSQ